jgi:hypothetical protein
MAERQTVCLRRLGDDRAEKVRLRRFLVNEAVTVAEMVSHRAGLVGAEAAGRHVLAIQDTSEINYEAQRGRKQDLGTVGNGRDVGLFVHPVVAVDAERGDLLGLVHAQVWRRFAGKAEDYRSQPIEAKESYRWVVGAEQAKAALAAAPMVTVVSDRESDIYEEWARVPDPRTHLLTRACRNRSVAGGGTLFGFLDGLPEAHRFTLDLPARAGQREARRATLAVGFAPVRIRRPVACSDPDAPPEVALFAVVVREIDPPTGDPIHWRLLTTHPVEDVAKALTVIGWYRQRWHIEQVFRTLKRQGLGLEQSVVESGAVLEKLAVVALIAATTTMQLVLARTADQSDAPACRVFDTIDIAVLAALQKTLQGRTRKQRNPHPEGSLAWAAWTIARLGGWTGYASDKSTGPITMRDGLQRFHTIVEGYALATASGLQ